MKIMFSAGEASGDMHGANLAKALRQLDPNIELIGMGGSKMAAAGVEIVYDIKHLGVIGVGEIIKKIPFFFRLRDFLIETMEKEKPDVVVCIDYPGFNMRLMKKVKELGIPVVYYILPTIWAWNKSRGPVIAKYADLAISMFPFERDLYEQIGTHVVYDGHPLLDTVHAAMSKEDGYAYFGLDKMKKTVLLMPGSRMQEVQGLLPSMLEAGKRIQEEVPHVQFLLPQASTISRTVLDELIQPSGLDVVIGKDHAYDMMALSDAAIVASGTATLETALMELPTLLIYRVNTLTYWLAKLLVHVKNIGLPNIIMGRRIMPELWQNDVTPENVAKLVIPMLTDAARHEELKQAMAAVRQTMGEPGAVARIAKQLYSFVKETQTVHEEIH